MNTPIRTANDVYRLVENLKAQSKKEGLDELVTQLNDALNLGSSGLEIMGSIRKILVENRSTIDRVLDSAGKEEVDQVIVFVEKAFGQQTQKYRI